MQILFCLFDSRYHRKWIFKDKRNNFLLVDVQEHRERIWKRTQYVNQEQRTEGSHTFVLTDQYNRFLAEESD